MTLKKTAKAYTNPAEGLQFPVQAKNLPATREMLRLVRDELKADIGGLRFEMKGETQSLRSEMYGLRSEMNAGFEQLRADFARLGVLVEEQNANNRIVLEGLSGLWQRQNQFDSRLIDEVDRAVSLRLTQVKS